LKNKCFTKKLKSYNCFTDFGRLEIKSTSITAIDAETFGNATFEVILFRNNPMLTKIDPKAFSKSAEAETVQVLGIFNSTQYSDSEQVFELVNYLKVKSKVGFDNIGIKEIPDNAFKTDLELSYLMLNGNKIKRIGKSAFTPLTNLIQLVMIYNNVSEIDSNGLTFNLSNKSLKTNLTVFLSYNNLTENSFHENWVDSKPGAAFINDCNCFS
jgi:Leucine-rich repeat (LRR) protein